MKVLTGFSAQDSHGRWHRMDVELDEVDLQRLCVQHSIPAELNTQAVFVLLLSEGSRLQASAQVARGLATEAEATKAAETLSRVAASLREQS